MRKGSPKEVAESILSRSTCAVQVGCCISDRSGRLIGWGWNSMGPNGMGIHAEVHAILRSNRRRLEGSTVWVASQRKRNQKVLCSRPCAECRGFIKWAGVATVRWRDNNGRWENESY